MDERDYKVGYGKPPVSTRFQKGHKGHKAVGPRKPKSLSAQLDAILAEKMNVNENGKAQRMAKEDVFLRQLINRALGGERQATSAVLKFLVERQQRPGPEGTRATDDFLVTELLKMISSNQEGDDNVQA